MKIQQQKEYIKKKRDEIKHQFLEDFDVSGAMTRLTDFHDSIMKAIFNKLFNADEHVVLASLGSYGRKTPAPFSDIDMLIIVPDVNKADNSKIEKFIQELWDVGFEVGHNFVDYRNWQRLAARDPVFLTTLLDIRYISGDSAVFHKFSSIFNEFLNAYPKDKFIKSKINSVDRARRKYGDSFLVKEPDIKDSPGGLRDYHLILWLSRKIFGTNNVEYLVKSGLIEESDLARLDAALAFLRKVRFLLHYSSGRNYNLLGIHFQKEISAVLGYQGDEEISATEKFMQEYYHNAKLVHYYSNVFVRRYRPVKKHYTADIDSNFMIINDHIFAKSEDVFDKDPYNLLRVFLYIHKKNLYFDISTEKLIEKKLHLIDSRVQSSRTSFLIFNEIITRMEGLQRVLKYMHFTGVLGAYIPEFSRLDCLYQEEMLHQYTVDEHVLIAVGRLEKLAAGHRRATGDFLKELFDNIADTRIIVLAVMFHDIGKFMGKNHAANGAKLVPGILKRIGFSKYIIEIVTDLVRKHLVMSHTFHLHDIENEEIIKKFCETTGSLEFLNYLALLTYFDLSSVSETLWTNWKQQLFQRLYNNARNFFLEGRISKTKAHTSAQKIKDGIAEAFSGTIYFTAVADFFRKVPDKYILTYPVPRIMEHIKTVHRSAGKAFSFFHRYYPKTKTYKITVCTRDQARLFSKISGTISFFRMSIVGADIFTRDDGLVIDTIFVESGFKVTRYEWPRIESKMRGVILGGFDISKALAAVETPGATAVADIKFDTETLNDYTIMYIRVKDMIGLLFRITSVFADMNLVIKFSKIMTEGDIAVDSFYFVDAQGAKIIDSKILAKLKKGIQDRLI